jgi:outer membrane protein assembly factor BamB
MNIMQGGGSLGPGYLYALDLQTGQEKWKWEAGETAGFSSVALADGVIYVGSGEGDLYALK